jgi:type VI secretion system Hcp family effector
VECPRIAQKPRPSFPLTPTGRGHRPLFMVLVRLSGHALPKTLVAIEAIAVYYSKPARQNGNPGRIAPKRRPRMGQTFLLTIVLNKQGVLRGSSKRKEGDLDFSKGMECHGFNYDLTTQYDLGSGQLTGRRQHQPITIIREVDSASPLLWSALCSNEGFKTATLSFARPTGKPAVYQKIELTNGTICKIRAANSAIGSGSSGSGSGGGGGGKKRFEEVSLTFEGITINGIPNAHAMLAHLSIIK